MPIRMSNEAYFTIHAGEFLEGSHLEQKFGKKINVWIPSKDTGVDFLQTDSSNQKTTSIQVKFSRYFLITNGTDLQQRRCCHVDGRLLIVKRLNHLKLNFRCLLCTHLTKIMCTLL